MCSGCRTRFVEWEPELGGSRFAYTVESVRCPGCEALEAEQEQLQTMAKDGEASLKGVKLYLAPGPAWDREKAARP